MAAENVMRWVPVLVVIGACGSSAPEPRAPLSNTAPADDARAVAHEPDDVELERLVHELGMIDNDLADAVTAVADAASEAERNAARDRLRYLQQVKAELQRQIAGAKARTQQPSRTKGGKISKDCQMNPLAKDCT